MSFVACLRGSASGREYPPGKLLNLDPADGRPLRIELDLEALAKSYPEHGWYQPRRRSMWRFGPLLPLDPNLEADRRHIVTLGEGHTPLLPASDLPPARQARLRLWFKDEGHPHPGFGENPTHSFKDRGMAVVASMARRFGLEALAVPTQGNAGDSLCRYALEAGLGLVVAMPEDTPAPILGNVAAAAARCERIKLECVQGTIREAGELLKRRYLGSGYFNCATFQEPGWRIEGKKTLGLEIAEALAEYRGWRVPEAIVYPTGGGTGVLGMWKAFDELECLGLIGPERPRIYAVQSSATAPLVRAYEAGRDDTEAEDPGATLAIGLNVPGGVGHREVLRILRASGGCALAVAEDDIARTLSWLWRERRWWLCPEGAAAYAALTPLLDRGELKPGDTVVVVNTGSLEKYLPRLRHLL